MRLLSEIELWLNAINLNEKIPIKQTRWVGVIAFKTLTHRAAIVTAANVFYDQYLATAVAAATRVHNNENNHQFYLSIDNNVHIEKISQKKTSK